MIPLTGFIFLVPYSERLTRFIGIFAPRNKSEIRIIAVRRLYMQIDDISKVAFNTIPEINYIFFAVFQKIRRTVNIDMRCRICERLLGIPVALKRRGAALVIFGVF